MHFQSARRLESGSTQFTNEASFVGVLQRDMLTHVGVLGCDVRTPFERAFGSIAGVQLLMSPLSHLRFELLTAYFAYVLPKWPLTTKVVA